MLSVSDHAQVYLEPARFEALNYLERILLYHRAHRCGIWPWPGPTGGIVQHLKGTGAHVCASVCVRVRVVCL